MFEILNLIRSSYAVKTPCTTPKLTPTGQLAQHQIDEIALPDFFSSISTVSTVTRCGFSYLLTNELTWEATKIVSAYSCRWVIEEFLRNAKPLTDMEGAHAQK